MTPLSVAENLRRRKEIAENLRGLKVMKANAYISDNGRIGIDEIILTDGKGRLVTIAGDEESPIDMRLYTGGKDDPETWQSWEGTMTALDAARDDLNAWYAAQRIPAVFLPEITRTENGLYLDSSDLFGGEEMDAIAAIVHTHSLDWSVSGGHDGTCIVRIFEHVTRSPPSSAILSPAGCGRASRSGNEEKDLVCHRCHSDGGILTPYPSEKHEENRS